jgi:hypothetical protein
MRRLRTAVDLARARVAIQLAGAVQACLAVVNPAGGPQELAGRTDVDVVLLVEPEVATGERAVLTLAHVPHGDAARRSA